MIILEFIIVENWSYEYYKNCSDSLFYNLKIYEFNNFRFCSHHISLRKIMCLTKISFAYAIHIIRSKYYLCTYFYIQYQNSSATFFLLFDCFLSIEMSIITVTNEITLFFENEIFRNELCQKNDFRVFSEIAVEFIGPV